MKVILIILLALSANLAIAQTADVSSASDAENSSNKVSFFERLFGGSKARDDEGSEEVEAVEDTQPALELLLKQLEGDFAAYKKDTDLVIESLQRKIDENANGLEKTDSELGAKISSVQKSLGQNLTELETETRQRYKDINTYYEDTDSKIENLRQDIGVVATKQETATTELNEKIGNTAKANSGLAESIENIRKVRDEDLVNVGKEIGQNKNYWLISILVIALTLLILYLIFRKSVNKSRSDAISINQETRRALEEESVQLDNKLIEVIETQLSIVSSKNTDVSSEQDHSLALKVADEIVRIQKNISRMDKNTKGLKQLAASVKRIQDNFSSNGYEIVEMLGKPYNEGMRLSANFIPDDDLDEGQEVITRIIKPQVNYQGVMIQSAQIEVSIGG